MTGVLSDDSAGAETPTAPSLLTHHRVCACVCLCGPDYTQEMPFLMYQQAMLEVTEQDHLRKVAIGCVSRDGEVKLKKKSIIDRFFTV